MANRFDPIRNTYSEVFTVRERNIPLRQIAAAQGITDCEIVLSSLRLDECRDEAIKLLMLKLKAFLVSTKPVITESRQVGFVKHDEPATPWEHFKRSYAPAWFTRKFPVRFNSFSIPYTAEIVKHETRMCPHYNKPWDGGTHVRWIEAVRMPPVAQQEMTDEEYVRNNAFRTGPHSTT